MLHCTDTCATHTNCHASGGAAADAGGVKLEVRQNPEGGMHIPGLTQHTVSCAADVEQLMDLARARRTTFATSMNEHSSRSHSLMQVGVTCVDRLSGAVTRGKLHLVDLAGSERVARSESQVR